MDWVITKPFPRTGFQITIEDLAHLTIHHATNKTINSNTPKVDYLPECARENFRKLRESREAFRSGIVRLDGGSKNGR